VVSAGAVVSDRTLPHSIEAEKSVLGSILVNSQALLSAREHLEPADFFRDAHCRVFKAMLRLNDRNDPVDFITLNEELRRSGELDEVGGPAYLSAMTDGMPRLANLEHHCAIVKEKARLRGIIYTANEMLVSAYDADQDASVVIDSAEKSVFNLSQKRQSSKLVPIGQLIPQAIADVEAYQQAGKSVIGLETGFSQLDGMTSGFQAGQLICVAGRPAMGKSAWALNVADHVSRKESKTVAVFSLEMSGKELSVRLLSSHAQVSSRRFQRALLSEVEYQRVAAAYNELADSPLLVDDTASLGLWEVRAKCRALATTTATTSAPLGLVVIDYVQLMAGSAKSENRTQELNQISIGLKRLAKELSIPIVMLSQLSRALEARKDKRPILSDLRESGGLEQDSDVVLFLYRDEVYSPTEANRGKAELIIGKQRSGPIGQIELVWDGPTTRFSDVKSRSMHDD
jgi:replicative DNA helicase